MSACKAKSLVALTASVCAPVSAFDVALSFWGGFDVETGCIVDRSHPGHGLCVTGKILCLPSGRGSSSSSSVLAEAIRRQTAPLAIVLAEEDPVIVTGALVAQLLYGLRCPVLCLRQSPARLHELDGETATLEADPDPAGDVIFRLNRSIR